MKISIAMATYNGAKYIREQLDSFESQTRQPDELVVCDDGSTDSTVSVIEAFAKIASFNVRLYQNTKNLGYTQNFGKAMELCTGDLIFLSDQDDVWFEQKIQRVLAEAEFHPNIAVFIHDSRITHSDLSPTSTTNLTNNIRMGKFRKYFITGSTTVLRTKILKLLLPLPHTVNGHDVWIHEFAEAAKVKIIIPEILGFRRRHDKATSAQSFSSMMEKPKPFDVFFYKIKFATVNPVQSLADKLDWLIELYDRVESFGPEVIGLAKTEAAIQELEEKIDAVNSRVNILSQKRWNRAFYILQAILAGKYVHFEGLWSAGKDLISRNKK